MPQDKDTLQSLGLYNGVPPTWWRKHHAEKRHSLLSAGHKYFDEVTKTYGDREKGSAGGGTPEASWRRNDGSMQAGKYTQK
jgi:hypothetical protein